MGLPLGQIIPGTQYRVLAKLGSGGMGTVYAAEHAALEKRVAMKVLRADVAHNQNAVDRLRDEARAASKIGSQFICDVTDFGQTPDGRVFYVMEYLDGQSLGKLLKTEGALRPERALPILRQTAKALEAAHEKGIVHLDIKPDNVVLLDRGRRQDAVKVVDFGVARLLTTARRDEQVSGTPEYVSPERFLGASYDHRADIYALGVLAYEILTGSVPFRGSSYVATLTMQVEQPPPPFAQSPAARAVPPELGAVVLQMLEKDPSARPASMAVVEAMLCEAQIGAGLRTAWDDLELPHVDDLWRRKLAERMPSPWGRQKKALLGAALAVAVAGVSAAVYFGARDPEQVVKFVEVTKTEEAEPVAAWLEKAVAAAREQRYTKPDADSALFYIQRAETEHAQLAEGGPAKSRGAENLRRMYAGALSVVGDELVKANLGHLAALKYKDALLFTPEDAALASKAQVTAEERARLRDRARSAARERASNKPVAPPAPNPGDEAKESAAAAYLLAAQQNRLSEARVQLRALAQLDRGGVERAKLADAFRRRADDLWARGDQRLAQPLYQLTGELDPQDLEARRRSLWEPPAPRAAALPAGAASAAPARAKQAPAEELRTAPRNPGASRASVQDGKRALSSLSLQEAETAFNRALEADPSNVAAVAGLAEVAFERSRYTEALDYARRAAQQAPRLPRHWLLLGDANFKLLRFADAQAAYEKALKLSPGNDLIESRVERVRAKMRE